MERSNHLINFTETVNTCSDVYDHVADEYSESGTWEFDSNEENLNMIFSKSGTNHTMKIIKLKENEMKLEAYEGADQVKFTFKKI